MKQEISKTVLPILTVCQSLSSVSYKMSCRLFHEAGTLKDHLTFKQVQQSSLCGFFVSSLCINPGKSNFFPKWLTNSLRNFFNAYHPLEVDWCCQEQMCLIVMKSPKFLKHFKCHILLVFERFEESLSI